MVLDECLAHPADARRRRGLDGADAALGARAPRAHSRSCASGPARRRRRSPTPGRRSSASCRAACFRSCASESARQTVDDRLRGLRDRRAERRRAAPTSCTTWSSTPTPLPAGRPAALPDGDGHAGGPGRGGRARHRPVRLRAADPQRPQRPAVHQRRAESTSRTRATPRTIGRSIRPAAATPAAPVRGRICGIFSWPARSTRPPLTRCIT